MAEQTFKFQTDWPPSPMGTDIKEHPTLDYGIKYLYEWGIGLGGIAVFIVLVMAGFQYITSVGDPTKMKEAQNRIKDAVVGLIILLSSWAILNFVGLNLGSLKVSIFEPQFVNPFHQCDQSDGKPDPKCCKTEKTNEDGSKEEIAIPNCVEDMWICQNHTCQPNTKTQKCVEVRILYSDGTNTSIISNTTSGSNTTSEGNVFNKNVPLDINKTIVGLERYYQDEETNKKTLCYDNTNPQANKDPGKNKPCDCVVQVLTKSTTTQTGSNVSQCSNTQGQDFSVNTTDFVSKDASQKIVCVNVNAPQ